MEMKPMNKYEFLSQLRNALSNLPTEEREAAMSYYEEFFSDAGEENEQAVIASLGTPEELARSILSENTENVKTDKDTNYVNGYDPGSNSNAGYGGYSGFTPPPTPAQYAKKWTGGQIALLVVLAVFSSPVWITVTAVLISLIAAFFAAIIGLFAGFGGGAIGLFAGGMVALFERPVTGIFMLGLSLILGGLIPLAIYPLCKAIFKLIEVCAKGIGALFNKLTGRKEIRR